MSTPWTAAERRLLAARYLAGASQAELAAVLGRSPGAVRAALHRDGVRRRRAWTAAEDSRLRALRAQGLTLAACAAELDRTLVAVESRWAALRARA